MPKNSVLQYESELKANKFLLVLAGDTPEIEKAREALKASSHASFDHHAGTSETPAAAAV